MQTVLGLLIFVGPIMLIVGLVSLLHYYMRYRELPEPKEHHSALSLVAASLVAGLVAFPIGAAIGIAAACTSQDAGNLCGLVGVFGLGPFLTGVTILAVARAWGKHACSAP